jgi:cobalamin biosynthesis protein CobD/CbiB
MNAWLKRVVGALALLVLVAVTVHLAWELLRPAVPALIALLVAVVILARLLRGPKQW